MRKGQNPMLKYRGRPLTARRIHGAIRDRVEDVIHPLNSFVGVFDTFDEARRAAPSFRRVGYEHAVSANWYLKKLQGVTLEDYPVLFWLRAALEESRSLYEIGGHVGVAYYGYQSVLAYPPDLDWTICDVPDVVEAGRKLAAERGRTNLEFVSGPNEVEGADIVLTVGALQYVDAPTLADTLHSFSKKPLHLLVSNTPTWDGSSFVTLQNLGTVFAPYRIFNRAEFLSSLEELGYELVDSWHKMREVRIPRHPDKFTDRYSGFYLRRSR